MIKNLPFGQVEKYQKRQQMNKRIRKVLRQLLKVVYCPLDKKTIEQFIDAVEPLGATYKDYARLPYFSNRRDKSSRKNKTECLFALISYIIQLWWSFCQDNKLAALNLKGYLQKLETIAKNGLDNYDVVGNIKLGYTLKINGGVGVASQVQA